MKKLFFLFLLLPLSLFASKILSYNIYDRTDRADVMITFDTPYEGVIKQSTSSTQIIIKLEDAEIEAPKVKKTTSKYLYSLSITPMKGYTQIIASIPSFVKLQASKTSDSYGLRLRFIDKNILKPKQPQQTSTSSNPFANLPTKKDSGVTTNYYIVISILIIGILILLYLKKKMPHAPATKQKQSSWLFNSNNAKTPIKTDTSMKDLNQENVSIRFQKPLNEKSSVVMLDFGQQSYLILMGENNILLDKFTDDKPVTNDDFEQILRSRHQELDEFLQVENEPNKEPLQSYKEKASSISFDV